MDVIGKFNTAKIFNENVDGTAIEQIKTICDLEIFKGNKIRIMPDVHAGKGCTIGTTMKIVKHIIPNLVGVDIGCGVEVVKIKQKEIDLFLLDETIKTSVPAGRSVHQQSVVNFDDIERLNCFKSLIGIKRIGCSIGTLGGGNHFIEINKDVEGNLYLVIHSGSRNLGKQVAEYYQNLAHETLCGKAQFVKQRDLVLKEYKEQGRQGDIQAEIERLQQAFFDKVAEERKDLAYLTGQNFDMYIEDMAICQEFATLNRKTIASVIMKKMNFSVEENFTTIHNYIDLDNMILRKGAVSSQKGEKLLIPMNMRDGSLICVGKGNEDWNYSAPHGAGRLMSRMTAKNSINFEDFKNSMQEVFSTTVNRKTIDEAPMAYKPMSEIVENIKETVEIQKIIKPIYNFKSLD